MKKLLISLVAVSFIVPQVTLAAWWNPFSWFKKITPQLAPQAQVGNAENQVTETPSANQTASTSLGGSTIAVEPKLTSKTFTKSLYFGMTDPEVKNLQILLAKDKSIYPEGKISGEFDAATKKAVQRFQDKYNLATPAQKTTSNYGAVGPKTREMLITVFGEIRKSRGSGENTSVVSTTKTISEKPKSKTEILPVVNKLLPSHVIYDDVENNCHIDIYPSFHYEQADVVSAIDEIKTFSTEFYQKICRHTKEIKYDDTCKDLPHGTGQRVGGCAGNTDYRIGLTDVKVTSAILVHEACHLHQNYASSGGASDKYPKEPECYGEQDRFSEIMTKKTATPSIPNISSSIKEGALSGSKIDYATGEVPVGVAFDNITNSVWVSNWRSGTISKINNVTGARVDYVVGPRPFGIAFDGVTKSVWVVSWDSKTVSKVDIFTGTRVDYSVGNNPAGVVFDPVTTSLWVASFYYIDIIKMDIFTGTKTNYDMGGLISFLSMAFDPVTNSVWVTNQRSNSVAKMNVLTGVSVDYPVGNSPSGVVFDNVTNSIWVANSGSNTITKINVRTGARYDYPVGVSPNSIAFEQITNSVWVTNKDSDSVSRVDVNTGDKVDYSVEDRPKGIAFDSVTNSIWIANSGSNTISKIKVQKQ